MSTLTNGPREGTPPASPPVGCRYTYWVTRDCHPQTGAVSPTCRVWLEKPERKPIGERGSFWMGPNLEVGLYAEWSLGDAYWHLRVLPDDGIQCVRWDGDILWAPGMHVERPPAPPS